MTVRVAVTAVGGGVGQSIIKSLRGTDYETVGIDPDIRAAGLYMADGGYLGTGLYATNFIERLIEICRKADCKYLFSGFDSELPILSKNREIFLESGIIPIVSSPDAIELSDSKHSLFMFMKTRGFQHIRTARTVQEARLMQLRGPFVVKPDKGCRSQGVEYFDTLDEIDDQLFEFRSDTVRIIQEYVEGDEYTCGTVSFDGKVYGVIAMIRELRNGDTYKAIVDQNPTVIAFVEELVSDIKPFGPCNVQLRFREGTPYVLEINARCSGTTAARTLAGFNEPEMVLNYLEGLPVYHKVEPVEILRIWDEVVVTPVERESING